MSPGRLRVSDGTRTHDPRDHNPMLYQLSYAHQVAVRDGRYPSLDELTQSGTAVDGNGVSAELAAARAAVVSGPGGGTNKVER